jgi:hypothetical protein
MRVVNLSRDLYVPANALETVRVASSVPLSLKGIDVTVDGVVLSVGDRVLAMAQRHANGIYVVSEGPWELLDDPMRRSGSMVRVTEGRVAGGRVYTAFAAIGDVAWHFVSLSEAVLGLPRAPDDVIVAAADRPRGVRWAKQNVLNPPVLFSLGDLTSIPEKGLGIFDLPPEGVVELHVFQRVSSDNDIRLGKVRILGGRIVRRSGELPKLELRDGAINVRNAAGVAGMSAQLFGVQVPA